MDERTYGGLLCAVDERGLVEEDATTVMEEQGRLGDGAVACRWQLEQSMNCSCSVRF